MEIKLFKPKQDKGILIIENKLEKPKQKFILLNKLSNKIKKSIFDQKICFKIEDELYIIKMKKEDIDEDIDEELYECISMNIQEELGYLQPKPLKELIKTIIINGFEVQIFNNNKDFMKWVLN